MSALGQHNDPVIALCGGGGENTPIRWYRDKPATLPEGVSAGPEYCAVADVVWVYRNGQWNVPGERSAVA